MPAQAAVPLIVTGANHPYARTLVQFLYSAERHGEHRRLDWIILDLGLSDSDRDFIRERFGWANLRSVDFSSYPPHLKIERRSYAWKPILLEEVARGRNGLVFWFDAATIFRSRLEEPLAATTRLGVWSLKGQTPLMGRADARVIKTFIEHLNMPPEVLHLPERVTGAIGFDNRQPVAKHILETWAKLARDPRFILPDAPDPRHRWEQTLFSALLLAAAWRGEIEIGNEEVDISSTSPVTYLTTRNKLWSSWPTWTDLPARAWYHIWKAGDRAALRTEAFWKSRIEGLLSGFREHYSVSFGSSSKLRGPRLGYFADPFAWLWMGERWLFVERFDYLQNKGRIVAVNTATSLQYPVTGEGVFGDISCHASFPFLVEVEGALHMIPETSARRTVDLYQCVEFPQKWRLRRRLLVDIDAADSMLVRKDGVDYLLTSVREGDGNRHLEVFFSQDIRTKGLMPHPINQRRLYAGAQFGTGRCGGFLDFDVNGRLLRFMQNSRHHYGEGGQWMEITDLSPISFSERPLGEAELPESFPDRPTSHHLSFGGGEFAWDVRDRVRKWP
jgi:hypothetical protein